MKVLAIDTSNYPLGVGLADENKVIGEYISNTKKNHSIRAMPAIEYLLKDCETSPQELDKIVVAKGPGSYTGIRIGVTIAKTLAWSLQIPISGVSSLAAIAAGAHYYPHFICPIFDARRGRVYTGLYRYINGQLTTESEDQIVLLSDWCEELKRKKEPVLFMGNDLSLHRSSIKEMLGDQADFAPDTLHNPRPGELAKMGMNMPEEDLHSFVPNYIRLAEAEAKWLEKQKEHEEG
ncbi:tRNA (adenosine(37)-N6)-threonylcarbamoyltransferase complex dimerization subunit type 1 TsaB [Bacillus smithii]|uniref:tRNA (adenosine(37)-N6)-threonylcarbamoyltransferase complex dimerization subunit type 1 TsaB n=1 Tax=Bacillus smithii TaxID=1479 RepID=UPI003D1E3629